MADRKRKPSKGDSGKPPKSPRQGKTLFCDLDANLRDALDALLESTRRSLRAEVTLALEGHLRANGFWPYTPKDSDEDE